MSKKTMTKQPRLSMSFHETLPLNRPAISSLLSAVASGVPEAELSEYLRNEETLGPNYIKAMPRYARGAGLITFDAMRLTPLGELVHHHDPTLSTAKTQWLMHYHLSNHTGPGPRFWSELVRQLPELDSFSSQQLSEQIKHDLASANELEPAERSIRASATIFIHSYIKPSGLVQLNLLQEREGLYSCGEPEPVPLEVLAYALSDHWESQYGGAQTCPLDDLAEPGGFGSIFLLGAYQLKRMLGQLAARQILKLWQVAPPFEATRPVPKAELLAGLYDS